MAQKSLTVSFFGRDVSLNKTIDGIKKNTLSTSNILEQGSRKATYALGALTGAALKFAKAAADDEKGAVSLANTLKTITNASAGQIANVEKFIGKAEMFSTIADDKLRPAFDTLVRSQGSIGKAQKSLNLAMEIAAKTGADVTQVADAMAKAERGQFKALTNLTKIQPKASKATTIYGSSMKVVNGQLITVQKTMGKTQKSTESLESYYRRLGDAYKGSIAAQSETAAFKLAQFQRAMDRTQETLGYMLLPYLKDFSDWLIKIEPWVTKNKDKIKDVGVALVGVAVGIKAINAAYKVFKGVQLIGTILGIGAAAATAGTAGAAGGVAISAAWAPFFAGLAAIGGIAALAYFGVNAYKNRDMKVDKGKKGTILNPKDIPTWNSSTLGKGKSIAPFSSLYGKVPKTGTGGVVTNPQIRMVGEAGPEAIIPLNRGGFGGGLTIINNIQGSVVTRQELSLEIRNDLAQFLRRKGINPSVLGV